MNRRRLVSVFVPLLLAASSADALAQAVVLPPGAAAAEQPGRVGLGEPLPLSDRGTRLHQILYGPAELAGVGPVTWTSLSLRPDAVGFPSDDSVRLLVQLSAVGVPAPGSLSVTDRRANTGQDATLVVRPRVVSLPRVAQRRDGLPQPEIVIPFDVPFRYPGGQGLLVEIGWERTTPTVTGVQTFDALQVRAAPWAVDSQVVAAGCAPASGGSLSMRADTSRTDRSLVLVLSYARQTSRPDLPMLFALAGAPSPTPLEGLGAPGCVAGFLPEDFVVPFRFAAPGFAQFWTRFDLGYDPSLVGAQVVAQGLVLDPAVNALGLTVSDATRFRIASAPPRPRGEMVTFVDDSGRPAVRFLDLLPVVVLR